MLTGMQCTRFAMQHAATRCCLVGPGVGWGVLRNRRKGGRIHGRKAMRCPPSNTHWHKRRAVGADHTENLALVGDNKYKKNKIFEVH